MSSADEGERGSNYVRLTTKRREARRAAGKIISLAVEDTDKVNTAQDKAIAASLMTEAETPLLVGRDEELDIIAEELAKLEATVLERTEHVEALGAVALGELAAAKLGELNWRPYVATIRKYEGGDPPLDREMITPIDLSKAPQLQKIFDNGMAEQP